MRASLPHNLAFTKKPSVKSAFAAARPLACASVETKKSRSPRVHSLSGAREPELLMRRVWSPQAQVQALSSRLALGGSDTGRASLIARLRQSRAPDETVALAIAVRSRFPGQVLSRRLENKYLRALSALGLAQHALSEWKTGARDPGVALQLACASFQPAEAEALAEQHPPTATGCLQLLSMYTSLRLGAKACAWRQRLFAAGATTAEANRALKLVLGARMWSEANATISDMTNRRIQVDSKLIGAFVTAARTAVTPKQLALMLSHNPRLLQVPAFHENFEPGPQRTVQVLLDKGQYAACAAYIAARPGPDQARLAVQLLQHCERVCEPARLAALLAPVVMHVGEDVSFMLLYAAATRDHELFATFVPRVIARNDFTFFVLWKSIHSFLLQRLPLQLPYSDLRQLVDRTVSVIGIKEGHIKYIVLSLHLTGELDALVDFLRYCDELGLAVPEDLWVKLGVPTEYRQNYARLREIISTK